MSAQVTIRSGSRVSLLAVQPAFGQEGHGAVARQQLVLGMPHLGHVGLSEGWLLRECGHAHWQLIEQEFRLDAPQWIADDGARLYASFIAIEIQGDAFAAAREGRWLSCSSRLERVSRTLTRSSHLVSLHEGPGSPPMSTGQVEMIAAFVRKSASGGGSLERVGQVKWMHHDPGIPGTESGLLGAYRRARTAERSGETLWRGAWPVIPPEDFNGVGILYFPNYSRFADRAEWMWRRAQAESLPMYWPTMRRLFLFGNVDAGDTVDVQLQRASTPSPAAAQTLIASLSRESDQRAIALCETRRAAPKRLLPLEAL